MFLYAVFITYTYRGYGKPDTCYDCDSPPVRVLSMWGSWFHLFARSSVFRDTITTNNGRTTKGPQPLLNTSQLPCFCKVLRLREDWEPSYPTIRPVIYIGLAWRTDLAVMDATLLNHDGEGRQVRASTVGLQALINT